MRAGNLLLPLLLPMMLALACAHPPGFVRRTRVLRLLGMVYESRPD